MDKNLVQALTSYGLQALPEVILGAVACVLFLFGTWKACRSTAAVLAVLAIAASLALTCGQFNLTAEVQQKKTQEAVKEVENDQSLTADTRDARVKELKGAPRAMKYSSPLYPTNYSQLLRLIALVGGLILVLLSWHEVPDGQAADYHGCLLLIVAGTMLTGAANDLVTLFLALELISIPTYVLLYLPRVDAPAQEAAMKYFLLSIFSSALLLFGFSYLYGIAGTTNIPAIVEVLYRARSTPALHGVVLVALVLVVAGLGFKITAVPFHFYAPDVYQGTSTPAAALLALIPKVAGFAALIRLLGYVPQEVGRPVNDQLPVLLWIMAAVTMSLGNVLALLQDNVKRLLAYSSVAHAGYMLIGLAVADKLLNSNPAGAPVGGVEGVLVYLIAYGAMTVGAFAVLSYLDSPERPVETVDDLAGLGRTRPGVALLMTVFLFSLIGMPLTAGFIGKLFLFTSALGFSYNTQDPNTLEQARLFTVLALIGVINAAIGGYYYLRIIGVMFLRDALRPVTKPSGVPALASIWICALVTIGVGVYPKPLVETVRTAVRGSAEAPGGMSAAPTPERPGGADVVRAEEP